MICNNCGLEIKENSVCPLCNNGTENKIDGDFSNLFKEEKVNIDFNIKNILNDIDFKNEFENITVQEAALKDQYLEKDLSAVNIDKISIINDYYMKSIEIYKTKQKKNLELFDVTMLQSHVASFNDIVNNCNKFKKMVDDVALKNKLDNTIKAYNKEIHYIKKYFILPLYDTEGLLNRSKIVKLLLTLVSILLVLIVTKLPFFDMIYNFVQYFTSYWSDKVDFTLKTILIGNSLSVIGSVYLTEILFQIFLNITIKNKNFQVDTNKRFDILTAVALVSLPLSFLNIYISYATMAIFAIYTIVLTIKCFLIKKWNLESILEKVGAIFINLVILTISFWDLIEKLTSFIMYNSISKLLAHFF